MSQIFIRASSLDLISPETRLGMTWAVMTGMVALLVLTGTTVAPLSRLPQNH